MSIFDALPYDLVRGLHIISVIAWMAGMLMLPRFYAYQTGATPGGELDVKMIEAARRLRVIILNPAMAFAWAFGLILLIRFDLGMIDRPWLIGKLTVVVILSGLHGFFAAEGKRLARGERRRSERFWRMINEVPFVLAILAVLFVTLEPYLGG